MKKRPNIIFYFSDQQRWDTCGCYGQTLPVTPNLDKLAAEGTRFANAFTCQPVCGPARSCLQSGHYATETGCFTNGVALDFSQKHLADYFNEAGYQTGYVGKWHLASDKNGENHTVTAVPPERRGGYKDYWMAADVLEFTSHGYNGFVFDKDNQKVPFTGYRADCLNNFAIDFIHNYDSTDPFFLFISQIEPHQQNDHDCYEAPDGYAEEFAGYIPPADLPKGKGNWEKEYANYLGCCHSLDENVGRLINTLKAKGIYEDTIIIYTSDHGSHFRTRNREYKRSCHESSIHVPMIAHGPGFMGGNVVEEIVSLIDIPSTLLDCAEISIPKDFRGYSIKQLMQNKPIDWQKEAFLQVSESQISRVIRTDRYKYCVRACGDPWQQEGSSVYYEFEMYDLETDPIEAVNIIDDPSYAQVREDLSARLKCRMVLAGELEPQILPSCDRPEELQNDGYDYNHI